MILRELLKSLSDLEYDRNFSLDGEVTGLAINAENCQPGNLLLIFQRQWFPVEKVEKCFR